MKKLVTSHTFQIACILLVTIVAYANIFTNQFVWDDYDLIVNNPTIQTWQSVPQILTQPTLKYPGTYRPVRYFLSIVSFQLWGLHPVGYHLQTLVIHLMVTTLIFFVLKRLTGRKWVPFLTALFFGIHPVHVETITWISSGMDMIGVMFMLASILYYLKAQRVGRRSIIVSLLFAVLAYFSLELTLVLPVLLAFILWCFYPRKPVKKYLSLIPYTLAGALYLFIRWRVVRVPEPFGYIGGSFATTMLTMARAFLEYIKVLVWPVNLTVNHPLGLGIPSFMVEVGETFPRTLATIRAQSITDTPVLISIGLLILGGMLAVTLRKKQPLITLAIGWFLLTLLPVSNIIPTHAIMAERYLYLPSIGFCVLLATGLTQLFQSKRHFAFPVVSIVITVVIVAWYSFLTIQRNHEWRDSITLWTTATQRNSTSYIAFVQLGNISLKRGETAKGLAYYEHVLTFEPQQQAVLRSLVQSYMYLQDYPRALEFIQKDLERSPNDSDTWVKLGDIYTALSRPTEARKAYEKALEIDPTNKHARAVFSPSTPK